ncbi:MAG TPA: hypothetical protein VGR72_13590 [Candidatus Acidoferrales bacterium]|nr:hypothetical protein [Candidatus Acidoferrales bacterium]
MNRNRILKESSAHGFALLFVLFLMALVLIGASVAVLRIKTEGRRAKEAEMIWRGEQYERAVGRFYRKNGRFPTSLDDLVKGTPGLRFLREPYKDPMNTADGSWRLIYVAPTGQLIGSVRYITLQEMALADRARIMGLQMGQGTDSGQGNGSSTPPGASDQTQIQNQDQSQNPSPALPGAQPSTASQSSQPSAGQQASPPQPAPFGVMQQSLPAVTPQPGQTQDAESSDQQVVGGFIVGVASKINKPSLKVYKGGTTYKQWEFIYNPLEQVQTFGGGTVIGGAPVGPQPPTPPQPQPPQIPQ